MIGIPMKHDLNPVNIHVGRRIRQQRLVLGISQEKLGEAAGVSFQQIQKYERGVNRCAGECLVHIAKTLGVSPGWFYDDAPGVVKTSPSPIAQEVAAFMASTDGVVIARAFGRIHDPQTRRSIARFVNDMASRQQAAE
jgi:transcriptional regulator with XRE-family HTH domain